MTNKDSLREALMSILGSSINFKGLSDEWYIKHTEDTDKILALLTSHIEEAERKNRYIYSGVNDKHGEEIKAGDLLKDDWKGFLYKVNFKNGSFILTSTGYRINEEGERVKDWIGEGHTSRIYDNIKGFSERHEIYKPKGGKPKQNILTRKEQER